jgi:hypothetical protein
MCIGFIYVKFMEIKNILSKYDKVIDVSLNQGARV